MRSKLLFVTAVAVGVVGALLFSVLAVLAVGQFNYFSAAVAEAKSLETTAVQAVPPEQRMITVVGEGVVKSQPDQAKANIGVEVVGPNVKQASDDAAVAMEQLLTALKEQGIEEKDIQTSYYNVWVERPYGPEGAQGEPIYHVNNNVSVTIRDLDNVTTVLGAALEAGANSINGVNFSIADPGQLRAEARQKAIDDALATAQDLAALNGVEVGQVISVSEVISGGAYYVSEQSASAEGFGGGGGPISPGEVQVSVQLQVSYAIQ